MVPGIKCTLINPQLDMAFRPATAHPQVIKRQWERCQLCQARIAEEGLGDKEGLQAWFVGRAHALLAARGRRMMGWDEVRTGLVLTEDWLALLEVCLL